MSDIPYTGAFPSPRDTDHYPGMSLRDYLAGQALTGMLSDDGAIRPHDAAEMAYKMADAMMDAREKGV